MNNEHAGTSTISLQVDLRQVVYALSASLDLVGIGDVAHGKRVGIMAAECSRNLGMDDVESLFLFVLENETITLPHLL